MQAIVGEAECLGGGVCIDAEHDGAEARGDVQGARALGDARRDRGDVGPGGRQDAEPVAPEAVARSPRDLRQHAEPLADALEQPVRGLAAERVAVGPESVEVDERKDGGGRARGGGRLQVGAQPVPVEKPGERVVVRLPGDRRERGAELQVRARRGREILDDLLVVSGPGAGRLVDHAHGAEPSARERDQGSAEVGTDAHLGHGEVLAQDRVGAGVGHDERAAGDHVLAQRVAERRLAAVGRPARQACDGREVLAIGVDQGDEGDWRVHERGGQAREAREGRLGAGVEQAGGVQLGQPLGVEDGGGGRR